MTTIYFVRHAESDHSNRDEFTRGLTEKGLADRKYVNDYLRDKNINVALSSPYQRAKDTIMPFVEEAKLDLRIIDDFRERKVDNGWIDDFKSFSMKQWEDFNYKLSDGESLNEVQIRNIRALDNVLDEYEGKNIIVGTHGTALSAIINYYDNSYKFDDFWNMVNLMPWIVKFVFEGHKCVKIEKINVFEA